MFRPRTSLLTRRKASYEPAGDGFAGAGPWAFLALMLVALALVGLNRLNHPIAQGLRNAGLEVSSPIMRAAMVVFSPVQTSVRWLSDLKRLASENERLQAENQKLKGWQARAQDLERRTQQLESLARVVPEPKLQFATARVIADSSGSFVRLALIDAGRENGVKTGYPVVSADGVVGRVVATGQRASRLLLLTDFNSRIPVQIGSDLVRAVMHGDNGPLPKVSFVQAGARIGPGDAVVTSGVGGVFPRGLRVGTVVGTGDELRIEPSAHLDRLAYVSVLHFDTPGLAIGDDDSPAALVAPFTARRGTSRPTSTEPSGGLR